MDGFARVALEEPGFVGRLIGRRPKQNALREIHNLLADREPRELTAADVENVLSTYELPRDNAADGLRNLYRTALEYRVRDWHFALSTDGLQVEKDRGKDQFFRGTGDLELIGAVLETCLRQSR